MTTRILVNGAYGRMGRCVVAALEKVDDLELVAQAGEADNLTTAITDSQPDVVVDFTVASSAFENAQTIINCGVHPVIGTSGLPAEEVVKLQAQCAEKKLGGVIAPNFSLAAVLMMQCTQLIAKHIPHSEIVEMHHMGKQDAPSGSAMRTAELIAQARGEAQPTPYQGHELVQGALGGNVHDTPIHALRLPGVLAQQQVWFGAEGETLTLIHNTLNRESFMPGVLLACRRVTSLKQLVHGLEHLLD